MVGNNHIYVGIPSRSDFISRTGSNVHDEIHSVQGGPLLLNLIDFFILHSPETEYSRVKDTGKTVS